MKKFKILLSTILLCAMFLPGVSAYYSSMALIGNNRSSVMRYPMYRGTFVNIHHKKKMLYCSRYEHFLEEHLPRYSVMYGSDFRSFQNVYEDEVRHIGACAYTTALFLECEEAEALKFSIGMVRLCNRIIDYPERFNERLLVFVANYGYALLGNLFKEGVKGDITGLDLYRFSEAACIWSSTYCQIEGELSGRPISGEMIKAYMADPQ